MMTAIKVSEQLYLFLIFVLKLMENTYGLYSPSLAMAYMFNFGKLRQFVSQKVRKQQKRRLEKVQ